MEKQSSFELFRIKAHPLSPQALIHWRPFSSAGFSVKVLIAPSAPLLASNHLMLAGFSWIRTIFPFKSSLSTAAGDVSLSSTKSAVTPPGGVGPLHIPSEVGTLS